MSNYLAMWEWVKKLSEGDRKKIIAVLTPPRGVVFDGGTFQSSDVDVLEALKHWDEEQSEKHIVRGYN